jgi:hypothetical protein
LHCFGDSHAKVFTEIGDRRLLPATWLDVTIVSGATALGLANPRSQTRALPSFERVIAKIPRDRHLLFMLGEVDCGFVIWYRAQTRGLSPMTELDRSIGNYVGFMERLLAAGRTKLVIAAVPPPTILSGEDWGEVAHLRRVVKASLEERTDLTITYNARLHAWADAHRCAFLNYEPEVLDPVRGVVSSAYRNRDPLDHHLATEPFASLVARHLRGIGFE